MTRLNAATRRRLAPWLLPLGAVATVLVVGVSWLVFEPAVAVKSAYATVGLLVATAIVLLPAVEDEGTEGSGWRYTATTIAVVTVGTAAVALGFDRLPVLLVGLPLGGVLLAVQLRDAPDPRHVLAQASLLFALSPVTKYLATGFYFGDGDLFNHVRGIELLLEAGTTAAIPRYDAFPGLHVVAGAAAELTGLAPYDSLQLLGLLTFTLLVSTMYLAGRLLTDSRRLGAFVAVGFAVVYVVPIYANNVFPQSLALVFLGLLLYVAARLTEATGTVRVAILAIGVLLGAALVLTHHLTLVLFAPWLVLILGLRLLSGDERVTGPRAVPLALPWLMGVAYWVFERNFLREFFYFVLVILLGSLSAGEGWRSEYALGTVLPQLSLQQSIGSLASPEGLYFAALVAVLGLTVVALVDRFETHRPYVHLVLAGLAAAVLVLRTPILPDFERVRLPAALVFAFAAGLGLSRLLGRVPTNRVARIAPVALFAVLLTTTPMVGATDDLYGLHAGADLYELQPLPEPEVELSETEFETLRATAEHIQRSGGEVSTLTMTGRAMGLFGLPGYGSVVIEGDRLVPQRRLFVSRTTWPNHRISFSPGGEFVSTLVLGEQWLQAFTASQNTVYTTGNVEMTYNATWG